jgi:1-phosphatidylinositol-3-phosphate 5-kinase
MVDHKPLPSIPNSGAVTSNNGLTTLSIDARAHRSRLLHHFLSEIHEPGIESNHDTLVTVFEGVLDEMGTCISKGEWLAAFRKTREVNRHRRRNEKEKEAKTQPGAVVPKKVVKTHSGSGSGASSDTSHELAQSASDESRTSNGFTSSTSPQPLVEKQLLLCVAPFGSRISTPAEVNGFALIYHERRGDIGCTFVPGKFFISDTENMTVLYGDKDWIGKLSLLPDATRHRRILFQFPSTRRTS